jgi:hypothetical protein
MVWHIQVSQTRVRIGNSVLERLKGSKVTKKKKEEKKTAVTAERKTWNLMNTRQEWAGGLIRMTTGLGYFYVYKE